MTDHDQTRLGPYVLGLLDPDEVREIEEHLSGCEYCRQVLAELEETVTALGTVPTEAFLDGPPDDGELMLQRTIQATRAAEPAESRQRRRWVPAVAAAALIAAVALGGGVVIGQRTANPDTNQTPVAGSARATATDATTGATMATTVEPREGWSWVTVRVDGLEAGAECELLVTDRNGKTHVAGSWVVSGEAAREGSRFSGGVLVPVDDVSSVEVRTADGEHVVTTRI